MDRLPDKLVPKSSNPGKIEGLIGPCETRTMNLDSKRDNLLLL